MHRDILERNLLALSGDGKTGARLDARTSGLLSAAPLTEGHYRFLESRSGAPVPALNGRDGVGHPLHSLMDPRREAARLIAALLGENSEAAAGCVVLFGLGAGYQAEAALSNSGVHRVITVEYGLSAAAELLATVDYVPVFSDRRFVLLVDPAPGELEAALMRFWQPGLQGGIRTIPLRPRVELDEARYTVLSHEVKSAIEKISADYSVQAWFGTRWFSNIIRNVLFAGGGPPLPPVKRAAICAAGPSLEDQLPLIAGRRREFWLLSVDTALPALFDAGIRPDAVISLDCQLYGYHHFMKPLSPAVPLFLDLSSPPLLASRGGAVRFFAGGHPLARYVSRVWRQFPELDTSGGNVTTAAAALAEYMGAREIEIFGADFSYPHGKAYARGTWLYPWHGSRQSRLSPLETRMLEIVFRHQTLEKKGTGENWYYETPGMRRYRDGLEQAARGMNAHITAHPGGGAPVRLPERTEASARESYRLFSSGREAMGARDFLASYRRAIEKLPLPEGGMAEYLASLNAEERLILATLLPALAAIKRREGGGGRAALEMTRRRAVEEIGRVLG